MELSCNSDILVILYTFYFEQTDCFAWFFWRWPCLWNWSTINISLYFRILSLEMIFRNLRSRQLTTTGCLWLSKMINPVKHNALPEKQQMYFNNPNTLFWWFAPSIQQKSINLIVQCNEPGIFSSIVHCSWTGLSVVTCAEWQIAALAKQSSGFFTADCVVHCITNGGIFPLLRVLRYFSLSSYHFLLRGFTAISFRKTVVDHFTRYIWHRSRDTC